MMLRNRHLGLLDGIPEIGIPAPAPIKSRISAQ
jgi:hypothetical protein